MHRGRNYEKIRAGMGIEEEEKAAKDAVVEIKKKLSLFAKRRRKNAVKKIFHIDYITDRKYLLQLE